MTSVPFPKKSGRVSEILDIIHTDVCGNICVESNGRARYYMELIDDLSRYSVIYLIRQESEVFEKTRKYIVFAERQLGKKVKCIQSDNGKEYTSKEFDDLLKRHGITCKLTCPYSPEQNGVAERRNMNIARCLMVESGLPPSFWAEAINTANYVRNRCPTKSVNGLTPYQL